MLCCAIYAMPYTVFPGKMSRRYEGKKLDTTQAFYTDLPGQMIKKNPTPYVRKEKNNSGVAIIIDDSPTVIFTDSNFLQCNDLLFFVKYDSK